MLTQRTPWQMAAGLFVFCAIVIVSAWSWLGAPVAMPPSPMAAGTKLDCISYTPYQADGSPFHEGAPPVPASLIAADVARLAPLTKCLRTYSASDHGIGEVVPQAALQGLTVMQGIWISRDPIANAKEIAAAVAIAKANPGTVTALISGNEVLLRQEQTADALVGFIKDVKARSGVPVTYADVWEFWVKNPSVADAVDFMTIHILPFWEDEPVAAEDAAKHVAWIYDYMTGLFPGKRIIIGEVGWPSAGRMRRGALPSPSNQARVLHDVIAMARQKGITANIIEAFDQPWKRQLEGTAGGHWGVFDAHARTQKFAWGEPISNHPQWRAQAAGGVALAALSK
jgi:exo-beta-1,3-glucanase (GH17 family)